MNTIDPDSDGDGLFDGTETGRGCNDPATNQGLMQCRPDQDNGATTTSAVNADTDFGGKPDGAEDTNASGTFDPGETDPLDPSDDGDCVQDSDCGPMDSGLVCVNYTCTPGCRGVDGNGCPTGQMCSSTTGDAGTCQPVVMEPPPMPPPMEPEPEPAPIFGGGGCNCGLVGSPADGGGLPTLLLLAASLLFVRKRRRT